MQQVRIVSRGSRGAAFLVVIGLAWLAGAARAEASLLAYEGFGYGTATSLTEHPTGDDATGVGFDTNTWAGTGTLSGDDASLTFDGSLMTTAGNVVGTRYSKTVTSGVILEAQRNFSGFSIDFDQPGTYYLSTLVNKASAAVAGLGNNFATVALGGFATNAELEMTLGSMGYFSVGATNVLDPDDTVNQYEAGETYLLVAKVVTTDAGNDQYFLQVYGGTASDVFADVVGVEPTAWHDTYSAAITGIASSLNLRVGTNSLVDIDEIRVGTTWDAVVTAAVPEPSTWSMLAALVAAAGWYGFRRAIRLRLATGDSGGARCDAV